MPSKSKKQQRLMGMAYAAKKGELDKSKLSPEILKIMNSMSKSQIRDFAKTKSSNLPETSKKEASENEKEDKDCCSSSKDNLKEKLKLIVEKNGISKIKGGNTRALNLKQYKLKKSASEIDLRKRNENLYKFAAWWNSWGDFKATGLGRFATGAWNYWNQIRKYMRGNRSNMQQNQQPTKPVATSNQQLNATEAHSWANSPYRTDYQSYLDFQKPGPGMANGFGLKNTLNNINFKDFERNAKQPQPVTIFNQKPSNVGTKKQTGGYDFLDKPPESDQ